MRSPHSLFVFAVASLITFSTRSGATIFEVGSGKAYTRIEDAYEFSHPGDTIRIFCLPNGRAYEKVAINLDRANIRFVGVPNAEGQLPRISGKGFDYSGVGRVPRAVFQFNPQTDKCRVSRLEIFGAHNDSHNGAAIRINEANHITVMECDIHENDMGIMSNGDYAKMSGAEQRIERSHIHHNGDASDPGFNHNLYLGGTSAFVLGCEIDHSLTGHNFKSRAHYNRLEGCYLHDSANRECDFVDDAKTTLSQNSHSLLLNCILVKAKESMGNRDVIHFGQDGNNAHNGALFLVQNTIITPYVSPVVTLSTRGSSLQIHNNIVYDGGGFQNGQVLVAVSNGAALSQVRGSHNWLSAGYTVGNEETITETLQGAKGAKLPFRAPDKGDYSLAADSQLRGAGQMWGKVALPDPKNPMMLEGIDVLQQFMMDRSAASRDKALRPTIGAFE